MLPAEGMVNSVSAMPIFRSTHSSESALPVMDTSGEPAAEAPQTSQVMPGGKLFRFGSLGSFAT